MINKTGSGSHFFLFQVFDIILLYYEDNKDNQQ